MRTPEQIAVRKAKQRATALMTKCPCGNVASQGKTHCGACRGVLERRAANQAEIAQALHHLDSVFSHETVCAINALIEAKIGEFK